MFYGFGFNRMFLSSVGTVFYVWAARKEKTDCPKLLFLHGILQSPLVDSLVDEFRYCIIYLLSRGGAIT